MSLLSSDQRNLGMSMKVERSSLDQVKRRFELNKKKQEEKKKEYDFEERMKELREEVRFTIDTPLNNRLTGYPSQLSWPPHKKN
jgi:hypothetical protein